MPESLVIPLSDYLLTVCQLIGDLSRLGEHELAGHASDLAAELRFRIRQAQHEEAKSV